MIISFENILNLIPILLLHIIVLNSANSEDINVDLNIYRPDVEKYNTYTHLYTLSDEQTTLNIANIYSYVGFLVIQTHTFQENITLSLTPKIDISSSTTGTNVGLVWAAAQSDATFFVTRNIKIFSYVQVLLVISLYDERDPVPGGCNLSFNTPVAPYQKVTYNDYYILAHSQPPSGYGINCDDNKINVDMYHFYLPEYDYKNTTYFKYLKKMLTVSDIIQHGRKVTDLDGKFKYGRMYSNYRGTGEIFAVIANYDNKSSAYVSAVSYGCDVLNWETDCVGPVSDHFKVYLALMLFLGLFICFAGHRFFKTTLFLMGLQFGIIITYLVVSVEDNFTTFERSLTSFVLGCCYGIFWLILWWKFGVPLLSIHMAFILNGILLASIMFHAGLADLYVFKNDLNFWVTFVCIIIFFSLIFTPFAMYGHIISCVVLGAYFCVVALNYYIGGNLQYIVINTFRRLVTEHFNYAVIDPPFQTVDIMHSLLWIMLVIFGCYVQIRYQLNKPPFPPNRRGQENDETTPLLRNPLPAYSYRAPEYV